MVVEMWGRDLWLSLIGHSQRLVGNMSTQPLNHLSNMKHNYSHFELDGKSWISVRKRILSTSYLSVFHKRLAVSRSMASEVTSQNIIMNTSSNNNYNTVYAKHSDYSI